MSTPVASFPRDALFSSKDDEWLTPPELIQDVLEVLRVIDLDPAAENGRSVPARKHYTEADDGLQQVWQGKVYLNPPYGRVLPSWVRKLVQAHISGAVPEAILLVPARTDTAWWQMLTDYPVCFVRGRLKFSGHANSAPFPSAIFYLGYNFNQFRRIFVEWGPIYLAVT